MKNKFNPHAARRRAFRVMDIAGHWLRGFWPIVVVVGAGSTVLREAVVDSILSTPHPALVYGIFAVGAAAVWLTAVALFRYLREEALLLTLQSLPSKDRLAKLQGLRWRPDVLPVCSAVLSENRSSEARLASIEHELYAYEEHLTSTLTLPGYLSGALVGLGLVGTFVGLLGTLADLAGIFSAMSNMGGTNTDPVAMFTDMLNKLQAPMRSMGTAFVASLYGLLGSLVLGLVIYSVKRSGKTVLGEIRSLIRLVDSEKAKEAESSHASSVKGLDAKSVEEALLALVDVIRNDHALLSKSMLSMSEDFQRHVQLAKGLATALQEGTVQVTLTPNSISHLVELAGASYKKTAVLEQSSNHDSVQADKSQIKATSAWRDRLVVFSVRRTTFGVLVICVVVSLTYAMKTLTQQGEQNNQNLASTAQSKKEPAAQVAIATPAKPASEMPKPEAAVSAITATRPAKIPQSVEVLPGQVLSRIAVRNGHPLKALIAANPEIKDPNRLQVGQLVHLPPAQEGAAPAKD